MTKTMIGILGSTSYTGQELVRILARHPAASFAFLASRSNPAKRYCGIFPEMLGVCDEVLLSPDDAAGRDADCVFSCLPHALSAHHLAPFIARGIRVVDLSADFRIKDASAYARWYKAEHPDPARLAEAAYGLPERYRREIGAARICANPGCYATCVLLPLLPLLAHRGTTVESIIADSKSGVSGAGRTLKLSSHFVEANENISPYSVGRTHRHVVEMEQEMSLAAGAEVRMTFSPHVAPLNRGILSTIYFRCNRTAAECLDILREAYADEPFVRLRPPEDLPTVKGVAFTNYCDISVTGGGAGQPLIAVSAVDNLLKGASGQAVQNMNIMLGLKETEGLAG
jgi:N-acetyl-gamma-glutamyl-phosphate reductase